MNHYDIRVPGLCYMGGKHLSDASNEPNTFAQIHAECQDEARAIVRHSMRRESTGCGLADTLTPACSCGWKGIPVPAYEDYQMTEVRRQEVQHMNQAKETA